MAGPINPGLYQALKNRFGDVLVSNEGQQMIMQSRRSWKDPSKIDEVTVDFGEYYRVDCPYCGDARGRLYVNHCWNTKRNGRTFGKNLITCYNEKCDMSKFEFELMPYMKDFMSTPVSQSADEYAASLELKAVELPGKCTPLAAFGREHIAIDYLTRRGFDPYELSATWGLHYCESAPSDNQGHIPGTTIFARLVRERIIIPAFWQGKMVGWQARACNDFSEPKYYTMPDFKKRLQLFNGNRAEHYPMVVVTEGFMKCARVGVMSVALLGKSMSSHQAFLIASMWPDKPVCLLMDPNAVDDAAKMMGLLEANVRKNVFMCVPPEDPDKMDRAVLWECIRTSAKTFNIELPY